MAAGDPTPPRHGGAPIDRDKLASLAFRPTDRTGQTRTTRDEAGNDLIHHWSDDARQDVTINARAIKVGLKTNQE